MSKKTISQVIVGFLALILALTGYFIDGIGPIFYLLSILGIIIFVAPLVLTIVRKQALIKEKEEKFLEFTRDLVENVKSGTPVTKAIINLKSRDYASLSDHVSKLANQIKLGISLENALVIFAKETKSSVIRRAVGLISQAERAGGQVEEIIESVSNSVNQIEELKKERQSTISNLTMQGYLIFLIFVGIMLVLQYMILPLLTNVSGLEGFGAGSEQLNVDKLASPLLLMILTQSIFAGLVIGKLAHGKISYGVKHSFILVVITLIVVFSAKVFFG